LPYYLSFNFINLTIVNIIAKVSDKKVKNSLTFAKDIPIAPAFAVTICTVSLIIFLSFFIY